MPLCAKNTTIGARDISESDTVVNCSCPQLISGGKDNDQVKKYIVLEIDLFFFLIDKLKGQGMVVGGRI